MNIQSVLALGMAMVCAVPLQAEELAAPSLTQGALISISHGVLSRKDAWAYTRRYKKSPEPCSLSLVVRELMPVNGVECYIDSAGLKEATLEGYGKVPVVLYSRHGNMAEIVLNAESPTHGRGTTYYLRNSHRYYPAFLARGGGSGATITYLSREGNVWMGTITGCFYCPHMQLIYHFKDAPVSVQLPGEGQTIDDLVAASQKAPAVAEEEP